LKDDNTIRKSMLKLVRMIQKLKNDKNRDDSLLFQTAQFTRQFSRNYCKTVRRRDIHLSKLNVAVCNTPHQSRKGQWFKWVAVIWLVTITPV